MVLHRNDYTRQLIQRDSYAMRVMQVSYISDSQLTKAQVFHNGDKV